MPSRGGGRLVLGTINESDTNACKCERFGTFAEYSFTLTRAESEDMSHEGESKCGCRLGVEDLEFLKSFRGLAVLTHTIQSCQEHLNDYSYPRSQHISRCLEIWVTRESYLEDFSCRRASPKLFGIIN